MNEQNYMQHTVEVRIANRWLKGVVVAQEHGKMSEFPHIVVEMNPTEDMALPDRMVLSLAALGRTWRTVEAQPHQPPGQRPMRDITPPPEQPHAIEDQAAPRRKE